MFLTQLQQEGMCSFEFFYFSKYATYYTVDFHSDIIDMNCSLT